jgi:translation initiation factor 3 subunit I
MRALMLKGHEGPITKIKYNKEGDLLFSTARKDKVCSAWYSHNGERLGTYEGHEGAIWDVDVNFDTTRLLTASADTKAKLWDVQTGQELFTFTHNSPVRTCSFAEGGRMILTAQEDAMKVPAIIFIYNISDDPREQKDEPVREMYGETGKIYTALWGGLNNFILSGSADGTVRKWNVETGQQEECVQAHTKEVKSLQFSPDRSMFVTASTDKSAKLYDTKTMKCIKTYKSDRPLNAASISPLYNHVIAGGGQDAMSVTTTSSKVGHFQVDFFHMVYQDYMGNVKGHFGPVNTCSFSPDGKQYASGSEDGYVRLHHFDKEYFTPKNSFW